MRLIVRDDDTLVGDYVATYIAHRINSACPSEAKPFVLGLPTGSSPLKTYEALVSMHRRKLVSFEHVVTFNMDEYVGLPPDHPQSYHRFMHDNFFRHVDLQARNIHLLDGTAADLAAACQAYEAAIARAGGIDLFLAGMGPDGHIAFNEPGSSLRSRTRVKTLAHDTLRANARFFGGDERRVPRHALTVGVQTVMDAAEVVVVVTGMQKALALKKCVEDGVSHMWTLSCLQMHPRATLVVDDEATLELQVKTVRYFKSIESGPPQVDPQEAPAAVSDSLSDTTPDHTPDPAPDIVMTAPQSPIGSGLLSPFSEGEAGPTAADAATYMGVPPSHAPSRSRTPELVPDSMQSRIALPTY